LSQNDVEGRSVSALEGCDAMASETQGETYSAKETARRADAALRRALNTPPQPRQAKGKGAKPAPVVAPARRKQKGLPERP
jgi:hypothetical protein